MVPADDQAMVLPWASVMVIMVLLNVAFTCATPDAMFLRSRRRTRVASLPIHNPFGRTCLSRTNIPLAGCACHSRHCLIFEGRAVRLAASPRTGNALLLLAGNRLGRALAGPGIGMRTLAAHRQAAAVPQSTVAAKIH